MNNAIREMRLERRMSQKDLAREAGVSLKTISGIETGLVFPRGLVAAKLAHFFKVDLAIIERGRHDE